GTVCTSSLAICFTDRQVIFFFRNLHLISIHLLRLHEDYRVIVLNCSFQKSFRIIRIRRNHYLKSGTVSIPGFESLAVGSPKLSCRSCRPTENDRTVPLATAHLADLASIIYNLVYTYHGKVEGHIFHDETVAVHSRAYCDTCKTKLSNWGIYYSFSTKFVQHTFGSFVSSVIFCHLFTHQENGFVFTHFLAHCLRNHFPESIFCHSCIKFISAQNY